MTLMSLDIRVIIACDKIQLGPFHYVATHIIFACIPLAIYLDQLTRPDPTTCPDAPFGDWTEDLTLVLEDPVVRWLKKYSYRIRGMYELVQLRPVVPLSPIPTQ